MNILLAAATPFEILPFLEYYREAHAKLPGGHSIDVLITGVGMTATTYALTRQVLLKRPVLVIQAGIAGCFDKKMPLGSLVSIKKDMIADLGVTESKKFRSSIPVGRVKERSPLGHSGQRRLQEVVGSTDSAMGLPHKTGR